MPAWSVWAPPPQLTRAVEQASRPPWPGSAQATRCTADVGNEVDVQHGLAVLREPHPRVAGHRSEGISAKHGRSLAGWPDRDCLVSHTYPEPKLPAGARRSAARNVIGRASLSSLRGARDSDRWSRTRGLPITLSYS